MQDIIKRYHSNFKNLIDSIKVTDIQGRDLHFYYGIESTCSLIKSRPNNGNKLIFIGNGGSAAIASHMAIDFWKNGGIKAISFNDGSLLTCVGNDFGYRHIFEKPIEMFAEKGDTLFAISSSGKSENILRGVDAARRQGCNIVSLSGFDSDNPLSVKGNFNFYAPMSEYGPVEVVHQYICHCILDVIMSNRNG